MNASAVVRTPKQLGNALRRVRASWPLTQSELGQRARLRQPTISTLEAGSPGVKLDTLFAVLAALDLELVLRPRSKGSPDDITKLF
jgi:HTH-type transcriptional regulator / antitoxin HipB